MANRNSQRGFIDVDDVGDSIWWGGWIVFAIFLVIYLVWSRPEIEKCEKGGGTVVRADGKDVCIDKKALSDGKVLK